MSTKYIASNWRLPNEENSGKSDNYGLSFDGTENINCGNLSSLNSLNAFSTSTWINYSSTPSASTHVFLSGGVSVSDRFYVELISATQIRYGLGSAFDDVTITSISAGDWHHLVTVHNNTSLDIYLDGVKQNSSPITVNAPTSSIGNSFMIGDYTLSQTYKWRGDISEVAVFDYALSSTQISTLYGSSSLGAGNPMALKPQPVAYYPLGDNSASNPLTQPNEAVEDASVFDFENTGEIIIPELSLSSEFSIGVWLNADSFTAGSALILGYNANNSYKIEFNGSTGVLIKNPTTNLTYSGTSWNLNEWQYLLITRDSSDNLKIYRNGEYWGGGSHSGTFLFDRISGFNNSVRHFDGELSNFQRWNLELTAPEALTLYNSGVPLTGTQPQASNLKAWYKLDQSANWEADSTGAWQIPDAVSAYPQSLNFVRTSSSAYSRIFVHDGPFSYPTGKVSASIWFKWNGFKAFQTMIADDYTTGDDRIWWLGVDTNSNGKARFAVLDTAGNYNYIQSSTNLQAEKWYHIAVTYDGTTNADAMKLYLNNQLDSQGTTIAGGLQVPTSVPADYKVQIGHQSKSSSQVSPWGSSATPGELSNACIWDTNLGDAEIEALYNNGTPPTTAIQSANLKGWWKLDDTELFDNTNWSIENQVYPSNWESAFNSGAVTGMLRDNDSKSEYDNQLFSMSVWVKPKSGIATSGDIFACKGSSWQGVSLRYIGNDLMLQIGDKNTTAVNGGGSAINGNWSFLENRVEDASPDYTPYDQWSHIVVVWNGTNSKFYINGDLVSTITPPSALTIDYSFTGTISAIGGRNDSGGSYFTGNISNFAYWESELDQAAVTALYNNGTPEVTISQSPNHWFTLKDFATGSVDQIGSLNYENTTGTVEFVDNFVSTEAGTSSGMTEQNLVNNNVSALNGESSGMTSANLVLSDLTRAVPYDSYSFNFDAGSSDYIDTGAASFSGLTEMSVSAWVKPTATGTGAAEAILSTEAASPNRGFYLSLFILNEFRWQVSTDGSNKDSLDAGTISLNEWTHIVATWNQSTMNLYVNGSLADTMSTVYATGTFSTTNNMFIGQRVSGAGYFPGNISNVSIFNEELTSTEVLKLYSNGVPQDLTNFTPSPVAWYPLGSNSFWNGSQWTVRDMIGSNDGTGQNIGVDGLVGDAPRSEANGTGTNMDIPTNLEGSTKWSENNSWSINMSSTARVEDTP